MVFSKVNCSLTTEFALVQENILLQNEKITQLYVIQSEQNPFLWFGVLFVDKGIYKGSVIRFNVFIEETYPECSCPKVVFDPIPPHPLVNPFSGELDTKNAFPSWTSTERRLFELFLFVKRVINQADEYIKQIGLLLDRHQNEHIESELKNTRSVDEDLCQRLKAKTISDGIRYMAPNPQKGSGEVSHQSEEKPPPISALFTWFHHTLSFYKVYHNSPDVFNERLNEFKDRCDQQSMERPALCGDDHNAIVFSPWVPEVHEPLRKCVLAGRFTPTSLFATYHKETDSVSFIPGHEKTDT